MRQRITQGNSGLEHKEWQLLKSLSNPAKIQDFLNSLAFDFDRGEDIDRSVRATLKSGKTDCAGGAILAAAALSLQGRPPLLLDLKAHAKDVDHIVALFKEGKYWGAISKTNHAVLRYREPAYRDHRELVMSYFHEYFLPDGTKSLLSYSQPFDLSKYGTSWLTDGAKLFDIIYDLDKSKHTPILTASQRRKLRKTDEIERKAGELTEQD